MYGLPQLNIDRINQQIQELEAMKNRYQTAPQPITNVINTSGSQVDFEARYIDENTNIEDLLVQHRTAFICLKNGLLSIKEINGDIVTYNIVKPKTPEELKIEELERRLSKYEQQFNTTINEGEGSSSDVVSNNEPSTKTTSGRVPKKA